MQVRIDQLIIGSKRQNSGMLVMLVMFQVQQHCCCFKIKLLFQDIRGGSVCFRTGMLLLNSLGRHCSIDRGHTLAISAV